MFTGQNPYLLERTSVHIQETLKTGKKWFPKRRGHIIVIGTEGDGRTRQEKLLCHLKKVCKVRQFQRI